MATDNYQRAFLTTPTLAEDETTAGMTDLAKIAQYILSALAHGPTAGTSQGLDNQILRQGLEDKKNPALLRELRLQMQQGLLNFFQQKADEETAVQTPDKARVRNDQLFIDHMLNFLPLLDIKKDTQDWKVPVHINGMWQLIEYDVEAIPLTPDFFSEQNRVYSYGFKAKNGSLGAPSLLINSGTGFPTADGEATQWEADGFPLMEVGSPLYYFGKDNIEHWLDSQDGDIHMSGVSLGADLTMAVARNCKVENAAKIKRAAAIDGARLMVPSFNPNKPTRADQDWTVVTQEGDPVSKLSAGFWPDGWNRKHIKLTEAKQHEFETNLPFQSFFSKSAWMNLIWRQTFRHTSCFLGYGGCEIEDAKACNNTLSSIARDFLIGPLNPVLYLLELVLRTLMAIAVPFKVIGKWLSSKVDDIQNNDTSTERNALAQNGSAPDDYQAHTSFSPATSSLSTPLRNASRTSANSAVRIAVPENEEQKETLIQVPLPASPRFR